MSLRRKRKWDHWQKRKKRWRWCIAGLKLGFPSLPQRRGKGTFSRSKLILLFFYPSYLSTLSNRYWILLFHSGIPFWPPFFFFFRVYGFCSKLVCWGRRLKSWMKECMSWRQRGGGRWGEAVAGSEAEGLYGLLKGVTSYPHPASSHPSIKKSHPSPSTTITQSPLQESTGPEVSDPVGQATGSTSSAATPALEVDIPAHMQPLRVQVGGAKHIYQCWVEGCKKGPSTSWATISAHVRKVHLGVGVGVPPLWQNFL